MKWHSVLTNCDLPEAKKDLHVRDILSHKDPFKCLCDFPKCKHKFPCCFAELLSLTLGLFSLLFARLYFYGTQIVSETKPIKDNGSKCYAQVCSTQCELNMSSLSMIAPL